MKQSLGIAVICLVMSGSAFADQSAAVKEHTFEVAPEIYYHSYEEPDFAENSGILYGAMAGYEYHKDVYARVEARAAFGQVDYSSNGTGTMENIDDWLFETRGLAGYDFNAASGVLVTPFAGFGYRYLNDDSAGRSTTTGARGYERESNYLYSPLGVTALISNDTDMKLRVSGEYDLFWTGTQKSYLSDASAGFNDLENDQSDGFGLRGSIGLQKTGKTIDWYADTFVRYWNIEDSDLQTVTFGGAAIGQGYEPANETVEVGAVVGVRF
jgi:Outer membrane protein beta-barrel domain